MSRSGILLYGPPASGKDTVGRELHTRDARCETFPRLKVGGGKTHGYRMISQSELDKLAEDGGIVWMNERYNAKYAIDVYGLTKHLREHVSIVHLGQVDAVKAICNAMTEVSWVVVELWCPRDIAEKRIIARGDADFSERLSAWDATVRLPQADVRIDTAITSESEAAAKILRGIITSPNP